MGNALRITLVMKDSVCLPVCLSLPLLPPSLPPALPASLPLTNVWRHTDTQRVGDLTFSGRSASQCRKNKRLLVVPGEKKMNPKGEDCVKMQLACWELNLSSSSLSLLGFTLGVEGLSF